MSQGPLANRFLALAQVGNWNQKQGDHSVVTQQVTREGERMPDHLRRKILPMTLIVLNTTKQAPMRIASAFVVGP